VKYFLPDYAVVERDVKLFEFGSNFFGVADHFCLYKEVAHDSEQIYALSLFLNQGRSTIVVVLLSKMFLNSVISSPRALVYNSVLSEAYLACCLRMLKKPKYVGSPP
jgi:hypothetical protein